uniref:Copper type II ascorbate-dependent monooxygenase C-terminal domain-containing protein n=1 Tax=Minutocellus polymorphus TaxID=265543 RepID=A0A7S0AZY3_9STRA
MTRTCTIESRCQDLADEKMKALGSMMLGDPELTCASGASKMYCGFSEPFKTACPVSCGLCDEESPRNMEEYKAISTFYHGHVSAKEMYMTLLPKDSDEAIDLKSRSIWSYDDQGGYDLDNVVLRPGDKIQTTCVYDSRERDSITRFDLATYDEMCLNTITTIMPLPEVVQGGLSLANEIEIRGFRCSTSKDGDIWLGELSEEEDARDIMNLHPLKDNECSFPTGIFTLSGVPTQDMRCNGSIVKSDEGMCSDIEGAFLLPVINAGHSCQGGSFDMKDSNDGTTEEQCVSGGGVWTAYNCGEADNFLLNNPIASDPEVRQFLKEYWWQPKCCIGGTKGNGSVDPEAEENPFSEDSSTKDSGSNVGGIVGGVIGALAGVIVAIAAYFVVVKKKRRAGCQQASNGASCKNEERSKSIAATRRITAFDDELDTNL